MSTISTETVLPARITLKARTQFDGTARQPDLDPLRRVLGALADSLSATYRREAEAAGIVLDHVDIRVEAGIDLNESGPAHLHVEVRLKSLADIAALEALRQTVECHDPLIKLVRHAIPTRLEIALDLRDTRPIAA